MPVTEKQAFNQLVRETRDDAELIYTVARLLARKKPKVSLADVVVPILKGFRSRPIPQPGTQEEPQCKAR